MGQQPLARLTALWNTVSTVSETASGLLDLARQSRVYQFNVALDRPLTLYLQTEHAEIRIMRWAQPRVEITANLQLPLGWRMAAEQDEWGVYIAARRKPVVGRLSTAVFEVLVPGHTYLMLKCSESGVYLGNVDGTVHISTT